MREHADRLPHPLSRPIARSHSSVPTNLSICPHICISTRHRESSRIYLPETLFSFNKFVEDRKQKFVRRSPDFSKIISITSPVFGVSRLLIIEDEENLNIYRGDDSNLSNNCHSSERKDLTSLNYDDLSFSLSLNQNQFLRKDVPQKIKIQVFSWIPFR